MFIFISSLWIFAVGLPTVSATTPEPQVVLDLGVRDSDTLDLSACWAAVFESGLFPAIAADAKRIAILDIDQDDWGDRLVVTASIHDVAGRLIRTTTLIEDDVDGSVIVDERETARRIASFNQLLVAGRFVPMHRLAGDDVTPLALTSTPLVLSDRATRAHSEEGRLILDDGHARATRVFQRRSIPPRCCDGGLGETTECYVMEQVFGIWRARNTVVVSTGFNHQMDGCSVSPSSSVLRMTSTPPH